MEEGKFVCAASFLIWFALMALMTLESQINPNWPYAPEPDRRR